MFTNPARKLNEILVVDDTPSNLDYITSFLKDDGYIVRASTDPSLALKSALARPPHLIIVDVRMPEMDGFELCRRLKKDPRTQDVPVIFVSGLTDVSDRVKGFNAGGVDFVVKPFQREEILARVGTHLSLRYATLGVSYQNEKLEELVQVRTRELIRERDTAQRYLDVVGAMIIALDLNGCIQMINKAGTILLGEGESKLLGKNWVKTFVPLSERIYFLDSINKIIYRKGDLSGPHDMRIIDTNLIEHVLSWTNSPIHDETGKLTGILVSAEDVTERRIIEHSLKISEERYRSYVENAPDAIFKVNEAHVCMYVNPAACWLVGYTPTELNSLKFTDLLSPLDGEIYRKGISEIRESRGFTTEIYLQRKNSSAVLTSMKAIVLPHDQFMIYCSDISDLRMAEYMATRRAEELDTALDQLENLSAHIHDSIEQERMTIASDIHDQIGASLTGARMMLSHMEVESDCLPKTARDTLLQVRELVTQALESSRGVYTRLRPPMLDDLGLGETCRWYLRDWGVKSNIAVVHRFSSLAVEPPEAIRMDIFRIFQELLTNVARHSKATKVHVSLSGLNSGIALTVKDNGIGFEPSKIQGGFGLQGINGRVNRRKGSFLAERIGSAMRVKVWIPVPN